MWWQWLGAWNSSFVPAPWLWAALLPPILCSEGSCGCGIVQGVWPGTESGRWAEPALLSCKAPQLFLLIPGMPAVLSCPEGHLSECWTDFYLLLAALSFHLQRVAKNVDVWFSLKWERSAYLIPSAAIESWQELWLVHQLHHLFYFLSHPDCLVVSGLYYWAQGGGRAR